jgi:hypothetical protein
MLTGCPYRAKLSKKNPNDVCKRCTNVSAMEEASDEPEAMGADAGPFVQTNPEDTSSGNKEPTAAERDWWWWSFWLSTFMIRNGRSSIFPSGTENTLQQTDLTEFGTQMRRLFVERYITFTNERHNCISGDLWKGFNSVKHWAYTVAIEKLLEDGKNVGELKLYEELLSLTPYDSDSVPPHWYRGNKLGTLDERALVPRVTVPVHLRYNATTFRGVIASRKTVTCACTRRGEGQVCCLGSTAHPCHQCLHKMCYHRCCAKRSEPNNYRVLMKGWKLQYQEFRRQWHEDFQKECSNWGFVARQRLETGVCHMCQNQWPVCQCTWDKLSMHVVEKPDKDSDGDWTDSSNED